MVVERLEPPILTEGVRAIIDRLNARVFDVEDPIYGAVGDNVANDRAAFQAAIDAAVAAGGGTVWLPRPVTYKVQITTPTSGTTSATGTHHLRIDGNYITIDGVPGAKISCLVLGGDPDTNWEVFGGTTVWRGGGIFISGGATWADRRHHVTIRNIEIDGNYTYTGSHSYPANIVTGNGWDITHKGIWFGNDKYASDCLIENVHIHNFSGEVIYTGGADTGATPVLGKFIVRDCHVHDTNGSAISMSGQDVEISNCRVYTASGNGIENAASEGRHHIFNNRIDNVMLACISPIGFGEAVGGFDIHHNVMRQGASMGPDAIYAASLWNSFIHHNISIDCRMVFQVGAGYPNDDSRDVEIASNRFIADAKTYSCLSIALNAGQIYRYKIINNTTSRTPAAVAGGFDISQPIAGNPLMDWGQVVLSGNSFNGTHGSTDSAKVLNSLLTTTSQTTVASRKPNDDGMFLVCIAYQVITATTNVTITITSIDPIDGASYTLTPLALTATAIGTYTLPCVLVPVNARGTVSVKVTAGTANQVYFSAVIRET